MPVLVPKGFLILSKDGHKHSGVYRGMLELLARFGYASTDEVMYGFDLTWQTALNRFVYLEELGLVKKFASDTRPPWFYCLTAGGREAVRGFDISEDVCVFVPSYYVWSMQKHQRTMMKVFLALKKLLGAHFQGWVSERTLKSEAESDARLMGRDKRVWDGECLLNVELQEHTEGLNGVLIPTGKTKTEQWRCAVELELSLKSPERYRRQFSTLAKQVYDSWDKKQTVPVMLFLYSTPAVYDRLMKYLNEPGKDYGNCIFFFAQEDQFLKDLGTASMTRVLRGEHLILPASQMNIVRYSL